MTVQHVDITDPNLHEPKGVAAAAVGQVYVTDGLGSGVMTLLPTVTDVGFTEELIAASVTAVQEPIALDTDFQVDFGPAQNGPTDPVSLDGLGVITFNEAGVYFVRVDVHFGRTGGAGVAQINSRFLFSGFQTTPTYSALLDNADLLVPYSSYFVAHIDAAVTMVLEISRDPSGVNEGGLYELPVTSTGWSSSFSSRVSIGRLTDA